MINKVQIVEVTKNMNAVGNIGQFVIDNQYTIEIILLVLLALIIVFWLVNRLVFRKRRNNEIKDINNKISKIEKEVKAISGHAFMDLVAGKDGSKDASEVAIAADTAADEIPDIDEAIQSIDDMIAEIQVKHEDGLNSAEESAEVDVEVEEAVAAEEVEADADVDVEASIDEREIEVVIDTGDNVDVDVSDEADVNVDVVLDANDAEDIIIDVAVEEPEIESPVRIAADDEAVRILENILSADRSGPKYRTRDWNRDRHGNVYSEEMLRERIG